MIKVPAGLWRRYDEQLEGANVPSGDRADYRKWLRYYLDFCHKYGHAYAASDSLPPFLEKLASKRQGDAQRGQAGQAVRLYHRMLAESAAGEQPGREAAADVPQSDVPGRPAPSRATERSRDETDAPRAASWREQYQAMRDQIQMRNYSPKTLNTYTHWTRRFQSFTRSKPPEVLDTEDVKAFLTDLAVREHVSASTQNQAFNALLFFYRHALGREFGKVDGVARAKRQPYIPVVLSRDEVDAVIAELDPPHDLIVKLLYGCGLRISECTELRVHCFNLAEKLLTVHDGKGQKDRTRTRLRVCSSEPADSEVCGSSMMTRLGRTLRPSLRLNFMPRMRPVMPATRTMMPEAQLPLMVGSTISLLVQVMRVRSPL